MTDAKRAETEAKAAKKPSPKAIKKAEAAHQSALKAQADATARVTTFVNDCPWIERYDAAVRAAEKTAEDLKAANAMKPSAFDPLVLRDSRSSNRSGGPPCGTFVSTRR